MRNDSQWVQIPHGNWVAPAGSYRSDAGRKRNRRSLRDETGRFGDSASRQAVTPVNVKQALETTNVVADLAPEGGRPPPLDTGKVGIVRPTSNKGPAGHRGNDDGMSVDQRQLEFPPSDN